MQEENLNKFLNLENNKSKPATPNNLNVEYGNKMFIEQKKNYNS